MLSYLFLRKFSNFAIKKTLMLDNAVTLRIIKGNIYDENADAIVCTSNRRLKYDQGKSAS